MAPKDDNNLVYSTDPDRNRKCNQCKKLQSGCTCNSSPNVNTKKCVAVLRIEKKHRGGREVTVIDRLPASEEFLKKLAATLKKKCGCGGTFKLEGECGIVEIQGDKRELIRKELALAGIGCKG